MDKTSAEAYLGLANGYIRQGEYEKALKALKQGTERAGNNHDIVKKIQQVETQIEMIKESRHETDGEMTVFVKQSSIVYHSVKYSYNWDSEHYIIYEYDSQGYMVRLEDWYRDNSNSDWEQTRSVS